MERIIIEPQFLPSIEFFTRFYKAEKIMLDIHHHYEKQTYRNRCYILGANKIERLSIPILASNHMPFKDVRVSYDPDWRKIFWRSLESAYANAPFYLHYADDFKTFFHRKYDFLLDLNVELLTHCLKLLNLKVDFSFSGKYENDPEVKYHDLRSVISPKQRYSARPFYAPVPYPQLFGSNFEANLSIIDLIFCEGPNAQGIVTKSTI